MYGPAGPHERTRPVCGKRVSGPCVVAAGFPRKFRQVLRKVLGRNGLLPVPKDWHSPTAQPHR